ncbi:MAG TPA: transglutaminase-like domain-containing protein [Burkholderiaceae bacterium]|nr:transglutaminase-like domain-containing protein [Burkholderiaceae bacterium]
MTPLEAFIRMVSGDEAPPPVLDIVARLPQYAEQGYDADGVVDTIRQWGARVQGRLAADASPLARLRLLNHFFLDELGFEAVDPSNASVDASYLHRVIERRRGLPIMLCLVYVELGRAMGLKLAGVGFPGRFLVKLTLADATLVIDVSEHGATLSADDLKARLDKVLGRDGASLPLQAYLQAADTRAIVARVLRNLRAAHTERQEWLAVLEVQNRLVALLPDAAEERRRRADVYERLECPRAAAADLAAYLDADPRPNEARRARARLTALQRAASALN